MEAVKNIKGHIVSAYPYVGNGSEETDYKTTATGKIIEKINVPYRSSKSMIPVTAYLMLTSDNTIRTILSKDIIKYWADDDFNEIKFSMLQIANALYNFNNNENKTRKNGDTRSKTDHDQVTNSILHIIQAIDSLDIEYLPKNAVEFAHPNS